MAKCKNCTVSIFGMCHHDTFCQPERKPFYTQAREAAQRQGHTLGEFAKQEGVATWRAQCVRCGLSAGINLNPAPGEQPVFGDALTTPCSEPLTASSSEKPTAPTAADVLK